MYLVIWFGCLNYSIGFGCAGFVFDCFVFVVGSVLFGWIGVLWVSSVILGVGARIVGGIAGKWYCNLLGSGLVWVFENNCNFVTVGERWVWEGV